MRVGRALLLVVIVEFVLAEVVALFIEIQANQNLVPWGVRVCIETGIIFSAWGGKAWARWLLALGFIGGGLVTVIIGALLPLPMTRALCIVLGIFSTGQGLVLIFSKSVHAFMEHQQARGKGAAARADEPERPEIPLAQRVADIEAAFSSGNPTEADWAKNELESLPDEEASILRKKHLS
jgi:hypothetical protein